MNNNKTGGTAECSGREIKFRYRVKYNHSETGAVVMKTLILPIGELEDGALGAIPGTDIHILSRDQFTGLHDKNGVEIYEGDIVEYAYELPKEPTAANAMSIIRRRRYVVEFATEDADGDARAFYGQRDTSSSSARPAGVDVWADWEDLGVIGNRFDNPELLEATK